MENNIPILSTVDKRPLGPIVLLVLVALLFGLVSWLLSGQSFYFIICNLAFTAVNHHRPAAAKFSFLSIKFLQDLTQ